MGRITPFGFDLDTARTMVGGEAARVIESTARSDADALKYSLPEPRGGTYGSQIVDGMRAAIYDEQYRKRVARNIRKKGLP